MKIKLLFLSLVLLATGVSLFGAHDFSGAYRHPNIPASKVVEADPPQVNTFCAANLSCTVTGAWSLGNVSSLTVSGTQTNTGPQTIGKWNSNCIVDGTANATLAAAITCAGSSGVIEIAMFTVPSFTTATIPAGVTIRFDGPSCLNNSGALTVNGPIVAPIAQIFCGTGTVTVSAKASPVHAIWFPGADWAAQYNSADTAFGTTPGTIYMDAALAGGTATTVMSVSSNREVIWDGGTWTSSASPNIAIGVASTSVASDVHMFGIGDGTTGTGTLIINTGTGTGVNIGQDNTHPSRGVTIEFMKFTAVGHGTDGITLQANVAEARLRYLTIAYDSGNGINGTAGGYANIDVAHVRVESCKNFGFSFSAVLASGPVSFYRTYANATSGFGIGYDVGNGHFTFNSTASDNNVKGYRLAGTAEMFGTEDETSSSMGIDVSGGGVFVIDGHWSAFNGGTPIVVEAAGAHTTIKNPRSTSTTGATSLSVTAASTGDNRLYGTGGLDKAISVTPGGILRGDWDQTVTLKSGSGAGNYTTASTSFVVADSTNLCYTVTIPTGWKLEIQVSGALGTNTAVVQALAAITDNATCSTNGVNALIQQQVFSQAIGNQEPFSISWLLNGDGNSHNIALQFATTNAADSAVLLNSSAGLKPMMVFTLMPSN